MEMDEKAFLTAEWAARKAKKHAAEERRRQYHRDRQKQKREAARLGKRRAGSENDPAVSSENAGTPENAP